jgi:hypothetical protein
MIHKEIPKDAVKITVVIGHKEGFKDSAIIHGIATFTTYVKPHAHINNVIRSTMALLNLVSISRVFLDYAIAINDMNLPRDMWDSPATITATLEMLKEGEQ